MEREIKEIEKLQRDLSERLGRRRLTMEAFDVANEPLAADLARLSAEQEALTTEAPHQQTKAASAATLEADWAAGDLAERRAMLSKAIDVDKLCIFPSRHNNRVFDRSRIRPLDTDEFATLTSTWNTHRSRQVDNS
ncbi:hypothetical protein QRX50_20975 [Amycolatopsis carbonis]|uniref:Uncharacterized protein n=1 Tax=Amycolatopsis carbonis TaxID=715471 RepID=A0A9Y2IQU4_9PSEU|nr:hypothetical protein [Amycolatopsis sp. 2-15]WIX84272.1 hypothetical protein QRX50_20975 [Amycolatopsis sp. 2-15]